MPRELVDCAEDACSDILGGVSAGVVVGLSFDYLTIEQTIILLAGVVPLLILLYVIADILKYCTDETEQRIGKTIVENFKIFTKSINPL